MRIKFNLPKKHTGTKVQQHVEDVKEKVMRNTHKKKIDGCDCDCKSAELDR